MHATEVDAHSLTWAAHNTSLNNLEEKITLHQTSPEAPLLDFADTLRDVERLDFVMTNPPFFSSVSEMNESIAGGGKAKKPSAICTGSENEMVTEGGEERFLMRILEESFLLRERVKWYTAMCGKLKTVERFVSILKEREIVNWGVCALREPTIHRGEPRTKRWAVAWSFGVWRMGGVSFL
jgi:23S rRNA (adenine1618-N6)-methyltransferase